MPFLRPFPSKLAVAMAAGFVLSGCMTTSRIPAPVEHRDSQQTKGIVVSSEQVALDTKQPGQADYRLAQTPQSGARGQWPESRIAATDPNKKSGSSLPPFVGVPQANGSIIVAPAQSQAKVPVNAGVGQGAAVASNQAARSAAVTSAQPTISRKSVNSVPKPVAIAKAPGTVKTTPSTPKTTAKPSSPQKTIAKQSAPKKVEPKQTTPKETAKVAMASKPGDAKPTVKEAKPEAKRQTLASVDAKFIWPAHGALVQRFADKKSMGIGISGRSGDRVNATADGEVIFSGLGPRGYGKLLIVKHNPELLSVYAHNRNLLVKEGQEVRQGQKIAELGSTGTDRPKLHFEIRRQGKPVDPLAYLPQRK